MLFVAVVFFGRFRQKRQNGEKNGIILSKTV